MSFSSHAKLLSNGLAVIDFGSRAGQIHTTYKAGSDWHREMFVQSLSFALSAAIGTAAAKAGAAGLSFLVALMPIGLVGLVATGGVTLAYKTDPSELTRVVVFCFTR